MTSNDKPSGEDFAALFDATQRDSGRRGAEPRVGERREVTIVKVGKDAVFVALDGKYEGFLERSEFSAKDVTLKEGMKILARVAEIGGKAGATRLVPLVVRDEQGAAQAAGVASASSAPVIAEGMRVKGTVTRVERYGVFVQIAGTQGRTGRGLVPAAETGSPRGSDLHKLFAVGKEVEAKVLNVEADGKVRLSIKAIAGDEERSAFTEFTKKSETTTEAPARSLGTFADLFNAKSKGPGGRK